MKKGFLKKLGTIVLGAFMAVSTIGFTVGLTACNFDDDNDHEIVTPVPDQEPDDPIIDPDDPSIEDPDDGKQDPDDGKEDPENPPIEEPEDPDKEDPDDGKEDPDNPPIEEPEEPVNPPEPDKPSREELIEAFDSIYGYTVSASGDDFIRDENGEPIKTFKSDELYETVETFLKTKTMTATNLTTLYENYYGKFSTVEHLFTNYSDQDNEYTIASLCEYEEPETENDKCFKIVQIPMDLNSNSFEILEQNLNALRPLDITRTEYDYKVSNLDYATEDYFTIDVDQNDKEFLDKCVDLAYLNEQKPQNSLILFQNGTSEPAGYDIGNHYKIDMKVITFGDSEISIDNREVRSSGVLGAGWVNNIMNYEKDIQDGHTYVVIQENGSKLITNVDKIDYNEDISKSIQNAKQKSKEPTIIL